MRKSLRALMVEDSAEDARRLERELRRGGFELASERVETAEGLREALQRKAWQLVLCDFSLPRFNGREALALTRASGLDLPFIYVSGTLGEEVAVEAMKAGAHDYVMKGNLKRLLPAVERELREAEARREQRRLVAEREQLMQQLQAALAEVQRLRGPVPICEECKSVRTESGQWQQLELFLEEHTEARFSRELCPRCAEGRQERWEDKLRE